MSETKPRIDKIRLSLEPILPYWRAANVIILIIAVFSPWLPGFRMIGSIGTNNPKPFPGWFILILLTPISLSLLLYFIMSLCVFISSSSWLRYLLFILSGINFLSFAWLTWLFFSANLLWGYWLACIGILSGLMLETAGVNLLKEKEKINLANRTLA